MSFLKKLTMLTFQWSSHLGHPQSPKKHLLVPSSDSRIYSPHQAEAEMQMALGWCEAGWPGKTWGALPWVRRPHGAWWRFLSLLCHCSSHPLEGKTNTHYRYQRRPPKTTEESHVHFLILYPAACPSPPALRQLLLYSWPEPEQSNDSQSLHSKKNFPRKRMN